MTDQEYKDRIKKIRQAIYEEWIAANDYSESLGEGVSLALDVFDGAVKELEKEDS